MLSWALSSPLALSHLESGHAIPFSPQDVCRACVFLYCSHNTRSCGLGSALHQVHLLDEETHQQRNHQQITTEKGEGGSGATPTSTQDWSGNTTKWWRNYSEQTTEQERERSLKILYKQKNQLQHKLSKSAQQNTRSGGQSDPQLTTLRERPIKERPNNNENPKTYGEPT